MILLLVFIVIFLLSMCFAQSCDIENHIHDVIAWRDEVERFHRLFDIENNKNISLEKDLNKLKREYLEYREIW